MKVLLDSQGATEHSGGMRLHAVEIISTWAENYPEDSLIVIGGSHLDRELSHYPSVKIIHWPNESILLRAPGQLLITPIVGALERVDQVISLSPIVSPLIPRARALCFEHDWRHIRFPDEFSYLQKKYRTLWVMSARHAALMICISPKAERETLNLVPQAVTTVIPNGRDQARRWPRVEERMKTTSKLGPVLVNFGHHNNNRPELVIQAVAQIQDILPEGWQLYVLGARGEYKESLEQLARKLQVAKNVSELGFVTDAKYRAMMSAADCVVLASSDEGFELPLAEAEYLGIPHVVAADSSIADLFPRAQVADPTPESMTRAITDALGQRQNSRRKNSVTWTWLDTVEQLRRCVGQLILR